jgi:hypothetical protein
VTSHTPLLTLQRVALGMKEGGQNLLEMTGQRIPSERCRTALTTRIVETDRNGREIRERIIFQGRGTHDGGGERPDEAPNQQKEGRSRLPLRSSQK